MLPKTSDIIDDVRRALNEDIGSGDITSELLPNHLFARARILSREPMMVCGIPWADCVFSEMNSGIKTHWFMADGAWCEEPMTLCQLEGPAKAILTAERTALNFLQTLSGTATQTHHYVQQLAGCQTKLLDTRKTLPGLRLAQKYAVSCAGGVNHRLGLYDAFLIKENHIKACGSIKQAVLQAKALHATQFVEVEVENIEELQEAIDANPHRVLLDNFTHDMIKEAVIMNQPKRCELEVSGGIHLSNIHDIAQTGIDYISVGAITKSVHAIDLSLLIDDVYM